MVAYFTRYDGRHCLREQLAKTPVTDLLSQWQSTV